MRRKYKLLTSGPDGGVNWRFIDSAPGQRGGFWEAVQSVGFLGTGTFEALTFFPFDVSRCGPWVRHVSRCHAGLGELGPSLCREFPAVEASAFCLRSLNVRICNEKPAKAEPTTSELLLVSAKLPREWCLPNFPLFPLRRACHRSGDESPATSS